MSKLGIDFEQLKTAVGWAIKQLDTPKAERLSAVREYVGFHYGDRGSPNKVPTNMIEMAVAIYIQQLAANAPRAKVSTSIDEMKPFAYNMQIALNQIPSEIKLGRTMRRAVLEALFGMGIVKVGLYASGDVDGIEYGTPFVDIITLDNYFCDMTAETRDDIQFEGNDYWLPLDAAKEIARKNDEEIVGDDYTTVSAEGSEKAKGIGVDEGADLYKEKVHLRDVWIADTHQLVTYVIKTGKLLRVVDWDGPAGSPYHILGFSDVPGNLLPLPPVALWRDLHELANVIFRKLGKQADAKKTVAAFAGGNDEDVDRLKNASDGDGIMYSGQKPESVTVGGIDPSSLAFFLQVRDLYSYFAGNLDALGGLSPMSDTVGQDAMIGEAANARINHMRAQTIDFARDIFKTLAWYEWTDPVRERIVEKPVRGTNIVLRRKWSMDTREGDFIDYNIDIDVYSMQDNSPKIRLEKIMSILERIVWPALPMIQEQGGQIDIQGLLTTISELSNTPEIADIVTFKGAGRQPPMQGNPQPQSMKPSTTTRRYERVNRPGATRSGKDDVMSRILMGGGVQQSEANSLGRMTG